MTRLVEEVQYSSNVRAAGGWKNLQNPTIGSRSTEVLDNSNDRAIPNGICEEHILGIDLSKLDADAHIPVPDNTYIRGIQRSVVIGRLNSRALVLAVTATKTKRSMWSILEESYAVTHRRGRPPKKVLADGRTSLVVFS
ncbi:hypothetical protein V2G26_019587 [Clonostachys chloroleuca]